MVNVLEHGRPAVKLQPEDVVALHWVHQAEDRRLFGVFRLKGAKHLVPDYQCTGVVLVDVLAVSSMVDAVVFGCVDDVFQRA